MHTPASIAKHPIHPMLVAIPIGLWIFSLACDVIRLLGATSPNWEVAAYYTMVGGIIGARLWHIFTPTANILVRDPSTGEMVNPYFAGGTIHILDILAIWKGGLGIPGAVIGGAVVLYFYARARQLSFAEWADIAAPSLALGQALGRWGNYFNQELYGGPTDLPWALEIDPEHPNSDVVEKAAAAVRRGSVVAIPTDALYTLVADPFNLHAVGRVFLAKGREPHRSLPLLVSDLLMAEDLVRELTSRFYVLARRFWPGPLTVIVPASAKVPLRVTGNTGRLAVRQSPSKIANALLEFLNQPLISTSANISGGQTPSDCPGVRAIFGQEVAVYLCAGPLSGLPSTVVDLSGSEARVLREGAISSTDVRAAVE